MSPVVESYTFVENGTQVLSGAELHLRIVGYDADQTPFSVENTYLTVRAKDYNLGWSLTASSINHISGNEYEIVFKSYRMSMYAGIYYLESFELADEAGNVQRISFRDTNGNYTNSFELYEESNTEITVSNITLSKDKLVLDDTVMQDSITITMDVAGTTGRIGLLYRKLNEYNAYDNYYASAYYDETLGKHQAVISMGHMYTDAGTFELYQAYHNEEVVNCNETSSFVLEKNHTDVTAPVIESVGLYQNGTKLTGGEILAQEGSVQIRIKANDASEIGYVGANLRNILVDDYKSVSFEYDDTLGCYIANVDLTELYATEWCVSNVWVYDIYYNRSYYYEYDEGNLQNYFYVKDAEGNCQIPTYTYRVNFANNNISTEVTTGRVTSMKEMFPNGVPVSTEKEGLTFMGWKVNGTVVSETDKFLVYGSDIYIVPVYDKFKVTVYLRYFSDEVLGMDYKEQVLEIFGMDYKEQMIYVEKGTTYGDVLELVDDTDVTHASDYTFEGWQFNEYIESLKDTEITYDTGISLMAKYKENPIMVTYAYVNEYGEYYNYYKMVEVKDGATYQDVLDASGLKNVKHYSKLNHVGWTCSYPGDLSDTIKVMVCDFKAAYDKNVLALHYNYIKEDLRTGVKREVVIYDETSEYYGMTYREAMEHFAKDVKHASNLTFTDWYSYYSDFYLDMKINSGLSNMYATAEYKEPLVNVYVEYIGEDGEYTGDNYYVIAKEGMTYQEVYDSLNLNYTHGGNKAFDNWKVTLYGQDMSSKIGATGVSMMDITALYKDAATGGTDTSKKDDTAQTPIFIPSAPVVETIETVETENTAKPETTTRTEVNEVVEEVAETKPAVKLETKVVEEKVQEIAQAEEGAKLVIEMKKENGEIATEVPVEILEAVKGKDVEITLDMGGYSWTINGKDVLASNLQAINLEVTLDTEAVAPSIVDALAGGEPTRQLSLTHNGDFGFKASLSINVGSEHEGEFGNLYYHDSNGKLVFMNAGQIDADGNVSLDFSHASDYVVVIGRDRTEEEALVANTDTNVQDDTSNNEGVVNDTNSGSSFPVVPIILVVAVVAVVAVVMMKKKK